MNVSESTRNSRGLIILLYSILFLFFFQLLSDFIEAIYVFGLMGTSIPTEIVSVLFFFSPVILLFFKKKLPKSFLTITGGLVLFCRVLEVMLDTRGKMLVSGLGVAAFLVFFPALLGTFGRSESAGNKQELGFGLVFALALSIFLRAFKSGFDFSLYGWIQLIGWFLSIVAAFLFWRILRPDTIEHDSNEVTGSKGKVFAFSVGMTSAFLLLYFAFTSPNVIARWTGANYIFITVMVLLALCLFGGLWFSGKLFPLSPKVILFWNLLFVASLVLTILSHQINFPDTSSGYHLLEPAVSVLNYIPLILLLLSFPIILIDFSLFVRGLVDEYPSPRTLGLGFTLAGSFMLAMILAHVFTTVYDYIPVIGPFFRDKFWLVYLVTGFALALPVLLVRNETYEIEGASGDLGEGMKLPAILSVIAVATIVGVCLISAKPLQQTGGQTTLRILTYNIQQGYSEDGYKNFDGQLELIQSMNADIIGLQESDTNRVAGGNADIVRYFADKLGMYSYYGPKTVTGTFGIALLSKFPIENPRTFYMYSEGEQKAVIEAQIAVGGKTFNIYVTHLGNGGPIIQQEEFLQLLEGKENVIAMGDFNFRPDSEQYQLTVEVLEDTYLLSQQDVDIEGFDPSMRIDHIFVTPGTTVSEAVYLTEPQSDHPAMFVVVEW